MRNFPERKLEACSGILNVIIGETAIINANTDTAHGISNGTFCRFAKVVYKQNANTVTFMQNDYGVVPVVNISDVEYIIFQHTMEPYSRMKTLKNLPIGYFRLLHFSFDLKRSWRGLACAVKIRSFQVSPRFCITCHKQQGMYVPNLLVADWGNHIHGHDGWVYVSVSRVHEIMSLHLLTPLPTDNMAKYKRRTKIDREEKRLPALSTATRRRFRSFCR